MANSSQLAAVRASLLLLTARDRSPVFGHNNSILLLKKSSVAPQLSSRMSEK